MVLPRNNGCADLAKYFKEHGINESQIVELSKPVDDNQNGALAAKRAKYTIPGYDKEEEPLELTQEHIEKAAAKDATSK